jgi:hypothetical protein
VDVCIGCDEVVFERDDRTSIIDGSTGQRRWGHFECAMRMAIGSAAHLNRECSCYVPGSHEGDPDGVSRRDAAIAAWEIYARQHRLPDARG